MKRSELSQLVSEKFEAYHADKAKNVSNTSMSIQTEKSCPESGKLVFSGVEFIQPNNEQTYNIGDWAGELFYLNDPQEEGVITEPEMIAAIDDTMKAIRERKVNLCCTFEWNKEEDSASVASTFIRQYYYTHDLDNHLLIFITSYSILPGLQEAVVFMEKDDDGTWTYSFEPLEWD